MSRMRDFVVQEILDIIAQKQFDNESIPDMSGDRIEAIADSIIYEWTTLGDPEASIRDMIAWNLDQNLIHA
tara:strand:- start:237 stop:449 length:213 start_codon:yes stop_codon:yes gene_type:complete